VNGPDKLIILATFCVSLAASGGARRYALRSNLLDMPNVRSSHSIPTPRGGGIAIVLSFFAGAAVLTEIEQLASRVLIALLGAAAVAAVGFWDDRRNLSATSRFAVHVATAAFAVAVLGGLPTDVFHRLGSVASWLCALLAVFVLTSATNLFNFMDGIDGIAASQAIFMSVAGAAINEAAGGAPGLTAAMLCLGAAAAGFLVWNWPPARLFMGDVGSGFLGFAIALLAFEQSRSAGTPIAVWGILGGVFLVDASTTLLRRIARGDRWLEPHRTHAYQHLARNWGGHLPVTLAAGAINLAWLLPWAWFAAFHPAKSVFCVTVALVPLVALAVMAGSGKP
jgi:Fuc2NAc and GlcNAc transferase